MSLFRAEANYSEQLKNFLSLELSKTVRLFRPHRTLLAKESGTRLEEDTK